MPFKLMNRTIEEVERLAKLLDGELKKINPNTLAQSEYERLGSALEESYEFFCDNFADEEQDGGDEDESL